MVNYTFSRELRLLTPEDFQPVFKKATPAVSPHITLLAKKNLKSYSRIGMAIPKKHIKKAVERNRIRRVLREYFRHNHQQLPDIDLVVVAKSGIAELSNLELTLTMDKLWKKLIKRCNG